MKAALLGLATSLAACSPQPRATAYFTSHPEEAARVALACARGEHRGVECQNAQEAGTILRRDARMAGYKKAFE